jgi:RimJ/RimL family protein N-acetyltransferase|tara:strand:+ start:158 stop:757 length:600 start_codon:yes stop_codon:yes gene_type:complete
LQIRPLTLENRFVRLVPFEALRHGPMLAELSERTGARLGTWPVYVPGTDWLSPWLKMVESRTGAGTLVPFAVYLADGRFAGMTAFLNPDSAHRNVEIGMTFYAPDLQGSAVNPACKHLLLEHAFGQGAIRAYFHIDERNARSRAAVTKLGAVQEGLLRDNRILPDGFVRTTVVFSILAREWPKVKSGLEARLARFEARG